MTKKKLEELSGLPSATTHLRHKQTAFKNRMQMVTVVSIIRQQVCRSYALNFELHLDQRIADYWVHLLGSSRPATQRKLPLQGDLKVINQ